MSDSGGKKKKKPTKITQKLCFEMERLLSTKESNAQKLHPSLSDRKDHHMKKEASQV